MACKAECLAIMQLDGLLQPRPGAQVMRKADLVRKNMVQSVRNERNIMALANNPFVVRPLSCSLCMLCYPE